MGFFNSATVDTDSHAKYLKICGPVGVPVTNSNIHSILGVKNLNCVQNRKFRRFWTSI